MPQISSKLVAHWSGKDIILYRITNHRGSYVEILNYGATLVSAVVPGKDGCMGNVVLNYPEVNDYFSDTCYLGNTIGRFANRIAGARFTMDGKDYHLDRNDGGNCNHSGFSGFNRKIFDAGVNGDSLVLSAQSMDGESGFPGNMDITILFTFTGNDELVIHYQAVSDHKTLFNPTCHAYFNLTGNMEPVFGHELQVHATTYVETDDSFLPTGRILPVAGTAFDFRNYQAIGKMAQLKNDNLKGYNACFPVPGDRLRHLATLREHRSGRAVDVFSTMPGVLLYTGDYLCGRYRPFEGLCLEAQFYPDAPNQEHFPQCFTEPGVIQEQTIMYGFHTF